MKNLMEADTFVARGHPLITATHRTTLEITREPEITPRGTCIVGVGSSKGCSDLGEGIRNSIKEGAEIYLLLEIPGESQEVRGRGHPALALTDPREMVVRTSEYTCPRTLLIGADRASADLDRGFVERLRNHDTALRITIGEV